MKIAVQWMKSEKLKFPLEPINIPILKHKLYKYEDIFSFVLVKPQQLESSKTKCFSFCGGQANERSKMKIYFWVLFAQLFWQLRPNTDWTLGVQNDTSNRLKVGSFYQMRTVRLGQCRSCWNNPDSLLS